MMDRKLISSVLFVEEFKGGGRNWRGRKKNEAMRVNVMENSRDRCYRHASGINLYKL